MPRRRRSEVIREDEVGVYHVWVRCVRRAWLCGLDPLTGNDYEHRKGWIESRLAELARIFAIDACVYAVLSNQYHLLLRNRPDLVHQWSDEEVARRWWQLCPQRCNEDGSPADPSPFELRCMTSDAKRIAKWRGRLSSISWLLQYLNQWLAKRANKEDDVTGHFIEGRFECRSLLDEGAVLAASVYIDLNEMRARLADTPEASRHTSIGCRILARVAREGLALEQGLAAPEIVPDCEPEPEKTHEADDCPCPINEQDCAPLLGPAQVESVATSQALFRMTASSPVETCEPAGSALLTQVDASPSGLAVNRGAARKAWRHGFLGMTEDEYLNFLDWNARQVIPGKSGAMDSSLPPILERMGMAPAFWLKMIENYDRWFRTAVGTAEHLAAEAVRTGRRWLHGIGPLRAASTSG